MAFIMSLNTGYAVIAVNFDSSTQAGGNINDPPVILNDVELGGGSGDDALSRITLADNNPNPWSSTAGAGYTGPAYSLVWEGQVFNGAANWDTNGSNPLNIRFQTSGTGESGNFHLAVIFDIGSGFSFDSSSSFDIDVQRMENVGTARWLVQNDGTYYLSQATFSGDTTLGNAEGLLSTNWAVYDIATSPDFDQGSASYSTGTSAFTNIQSVGIMMDKDNMTSSRHWFEMRGFTVDAVPEPGTGLLLGGALAGLAWLRRRKHA